MTQSDKPFPFLLHFEEFCIAWFGKHNGFYIDPNGTVYKYDHATNSDLYNPDLAKKWHYYETKLKPKSYTFFGDERDGFLRKEDLYENLSFIPGEEGKPIHFSVELDEVVKSIQTSAYSNDPGDCDRGICSYTLLIYDQKKEIYDRLLIKTTGDHYTASLSPYVYELMAYFEMYTDIEYSYSEFLELKKILEQGNNTLD